MTTAPEEDPSRAIVLLNPSMLAVMDSMRRNFEHIVDGTLTRIIVIFSGRYMETSHTALTIRALIMEMEFSLQASTQRYASFTRRFPAPTHLVGVARPSPATSELAAQSMQS
jgi:hypothetical protein